MHGHLQLAPDCMISFPLLKKAAISASPEEIVPLGSVGLLSPLGPPTAEANPVLDHCIQAGALHIIYLHVLHELTNLRHKMTALSKVTSDKSCALMAVRAARLGVPRL